MNVTDAYSGREQTKAKHFILKRYLQALAFKVLTFSDITYVDGFSGPWETKTEDFSDSSFMIAISVLLDAQNQILERGHKRRIRCFFSKTNPELQEEKEPGFERIFASACRMSSGVHGTSSARHFAREIRAKWPTPLSEWQRAINSSMSGAVRRPASTAANGMTSLHFSSFKWLSSGPSSVSISLRSGYQPSTTAFAVRYS
jgi:hypothetical protein